MLRVTKHQIDIKVIDKIKHDLIEFDSKHSLNQPQGNFFYDSWKLKDQYIGTPWEEIYNSLDCQHGEARLIVLQPGESYMAHADIDDRYHLNLSGNNSFLIDIIEQKMYPTIKDGIWYEMNAGKVHAATNYGEIPRVQMVVRKLLKRANLRNFVRVKITPAKQIYDYRYKFDNQVSPWLNRHNKEGYIDNFSYKNNDIEFDLDASINVSQEILDPATFKVSYE